MTGRRSRVREIETQTRGREGGRREGAGVGHGVC
jgi:hypothetical protein